MYFANLGKLAVAMTVLADQPNASVWSSMVAHTRDLTRDDSKMRSSVYYRLISE